MMGHISGAADLLVASEIEELAQRFSLSLAETGCDRMA